MRRNRPFGPPGTRVSTNINLDFIFGLPDQSPETWTRTLARATDLGPEHLSLYSLTVEQGTPLAEQVRRGLAAEPDDDLAADLYELACGKLAEGGYEQYEISNWARGSGGAEEQGSRGAEERGSRGAGGQGSGGAAGPANGGAPPHPHTPTPLPSGQPPDYQCRHNLIYWHHDPYLGCGAGAHSFDGNDAGGM